MTIADLIKSLIDSSKERVKTPITGAFIISFIAYNWKAILFLLFSTASIEDKLYFITYKYCSFYSILFPFLIAIFYSIAVPYLMMIIENLNKTAKHGRQVYKYDGRINEVILKIKLADQELKLQDKMSLNQEKEDMLTRIKELEDTLKTRNDSQKAIDIDYRKQIADLTKRLNQANSNNNIQKLINFDEDLSDLSNSTISHFSELMTMLTKEDISQLVNLRTKMSTKINTRRLSKKLLEYLRKNGFAELIDKEYHFNQLGIKFKFFVEAQSKIIEN